MMTKGSRILVLVAALALGLVYVLPVWRISLEAPQYPEGLGMVIQIDDIVGEKPHDLNNINNLNHYIGMKRIVPESIPELVFMPMILGGLILLGVAAAVLGRRWFLYGWIALFVAVSVVGLADFWKWEYDYGHNLDQETAAIQIPGMSYQPPLIGSRQILNFTAHSWPGSGGWIAILAAMLGVGVAGYEFRKGRSGKEGDAPAEKAPSRVPPAQGSAPMAVVGLLAAAFAMSACGEPEPRALAYGSESCAHCHMGLADESHGAELLLRTGKAYPFDSVECLVGYLIQNDADPAIHSLWVTDFSDPGTLIRATEAHYLQSAVLDSPMGLGLTAFARPEDRDGAVNAFGGTAMNWEEVRTWVETQWPEGVSAHGVSHRRAERDSHATAES
jgi:copper chaperone NosL